MALWIYDGFDNLSGGGMDTQMAARGWSRSGLVAPGVTGGRFGGLCLVGSTTLWTLSRSATATGIMGAAFGLYVVPSDQPYRLLEFRDGSSVQLGLALSTSHKLMVYRGTTGTVLATGSATLLNNTWYYIEFKATIDLISGSYEVRLDGAPEIPRSSNQNTRVTTNNSFNFIGLWAPTTPIRPDDFYALDTSGSAPFNDFLGEVRTATLFPNAAGSSTQWTPLSSTNLSNVDDTHPGFSFDADTTYNSSGTPGQIDLFACQDLPAGNPRIFSAQVVVDARKDDASARSVRAKLKSGLAIANGPTLAVPSSYGSLVGEFRVDPNTSGAWTKASIDACEIGYECIA